jgi:Na+/H+ antiporter NhaD/arsenite permease-like protein
VVVSVHTALALFALTYACLLFFPKYRAYIGLVSASIFVSLGILPQDKIFSSIDWNVILMIAGTMGLVHFFIKSKMPSFLADLIIEKMPTVKWLIVALSLFAGIISAFVDNVATVLIVAPIALNISKKLRISPVPSIIAIAISSNLQGAATLVGDTTSILLGSYANLDFLDFFFVRGRPGIFWIVQAGALASTFVLLHIFKNHTQTIHATERTKVRDYFPTILLLGTIGLLIAASFIPDKPAMTNGIICMAFFIIGLVREYLKQNKVEVVFEALSQIDYFTLLLLCSLFVVIAAVTETKAIEEISKFLVTLSNRNLFFTYTLITWFSVLFSAFIDNIPYVAAMLPVTSQIASALGIEPTILYLGLLAGATLGGNLTPIGASANIAALGILRKNDYEASARQFMKISVPFTLAAVTTGYLLIWFIWK